MPVITQKFIFRSDLQNNPSVKYLFGDNTIRQGYGGQAKEMRGEPNAIGVATKSTPTSGSNAYFSDDNFEDNMEVIETDLGPAIDHLRAGGILVIPEDGLGTGLSELPQRAPRTNAALVEMLEGLEEIEGEGVL